jgi:hypothetical protein
MILTKHGKSAGRSSMKMEHLLRTLRPPRSGRQTASSGMRRVSGSKPPVWPTPAKSGRKRERWQRIPLSWRHGWRRGSFASPSARGHESRSLPSTNATSAAGLPRSKESPQKKPVTITLRPLIRVHGTIDCPEAGRTPDWTMAVVHPPDDATNYLHFTQCGSVQGKFSFLLPPGKYDLDVYSSSPSARLVRPQVQEDRNAPDKVPLTLRGLSDGISRMLIGRPPRGIRIEVPRRA